MDNTEEPLSTRDLVATAEPPAAEPPAATDGAPAAEPTETDAPLLAEDQAGTYRRRWEEIQAAFVDEPRRAVEDADGLVAQVMQELAEGASASASRASGIAATTCRRRTCGWACSATARSSAACCPPETEGPGCARERTRGRSGQL